MHVPSGRPFAGREIAAWDGRAPRLPPGWRRDRCTPCPPIIRPCRRERPRPAAEISSPAQYGYVCSSLGTRWRVANLAHAQTQKKPGTECRAFLTIWRDACLVARAGISAATHIQVVIAPERPLLAVSVHSIGASGRGAEAAMADEMAGDAADNRALEATCFSRSSCERGKTERRGGDSDNLHCQTSRILASPQQLLPGRKVAWPRFNLTRAFSVRIGDRKRLFVILGASNRETSDGHQTRCFDRGARLHPCRRRVRPADGHAVCGHNGYACADDLQRIWPLLGPRR